MPVRSAPPGAVKRHAPCTDGPLTHFASPRGEKSGLAEISGFTCRARSLLCKRQISRQTATSVGAGRRAESWGTDAAGCAVLTSARGAAGGPKLCGRRGRIWASSQLSQSVLRMVFMHSPLAPVRLASPTNPPGWAGADAPGFGATPNPRIAAHEFAAGRCRSTIVALCPHASRLGRGYFQGDSAKL